MNNKDEMQFGNGDELDALFASARTSQPPLADDNFTKMVLNSLPLNSVFKRDLITKADNKRGLSFDLVGALLGLLVAYLFIDQTSALNFLVNLVPESLVLSPVHILGVSFALTIASLAAWWSVESNQI